MTHQPASVAVRPAPLVPPDAAPMPAVAARARQDWAERVVEDFGSYLEQELRRKLEAGLPYSTLVDGRVAWVHPDGVLRDGRDPGSPAIRGV